MIAVLRSDDIHRTALETCPIDDTIVKTLTSQISGARHHTTRRRPHTDSPNPGTHSGVARRTTMKPTTVGRITTATARAAVRETVAARMTGTLGRRMTGKSTTTFPAGIEVIGVLHRHATNGVQPRLRRGVLKETALYQENTEKDTPQDDAPLVRTLLGAGM
jgi:hypothetical protein